MDWLTKQKTYIILIIVLIALNASILIFLWLSKPEPPKQRPNGPPDTDMFLKKELGLNDKQDNQIKESRKKLFDAMRSIDANILDKKRQLQDEAFAQKPDTVKTKQLIDEIARLESQKEEYMFKHFSEVKSYLNDEQLLKFKRLLDGRGRKPDMREGMKGGERNSPPPPAGVLPNIY